MDVLKYRLLETLYHLVVTSGWLNVLPKLELSVFNENSGRGPLQN